LSLSLLSSHSSFFILASQHYPTSIHRTYHTSTLVVLCSHCITLDLPVSSISLQVSDSASLKLDFPQLDLLSIIPPKPILIVLHITVDYLLSFWSPLQEGFKSVLNNTTLAFYRYSTWRPSLWAHPSFIRPFHYLYWEHIHTYHTDNIRSFPTASTFSWRYSLWVLQHTYAYPEGSDSEPRYITCDGSPIDSGISPAFDTLHNITVGCVICHMTQIECMLCLQVACLWVRASWYCIIRCILEYVEYNPSCIQ